MFRSEVTTALCSLRERWPTDEAPGLDGGPELVGKSAGALGIHNKVLGGASWVRVRLPGKAGGSDKK